MLAAPASTAAPPRAKSSASWNPAVPPPPVAGAAAGSALDDGLGSTDFDSEGLGATGCDPGGLALGIAVGLRVPLGKPVGIGEMVPAGENEDDGDGAADGVDPEQPETAAEAIMAMVAQPITVNPALSPIPAAVMRAFMEPPHAPRQEAVWFPGPSAETGAGSEHTWQPGRCPRGPKGGPRKRRSWQR